MSSAFLMVIFESSVIRTSWYISATGPDLPQALNYFDPQDVDNTVFAAEIYFLLTIQRLYKFSIFIQLFITLLTKLSDINALAHNLSVLALRLQWRTPKFEVLQNSDTGKLSTYLCSVHIFRVSFKSYKDTVRPWSQKTVTWSSFTRYLGSSWSTTLQRRSVYSGWYCVYMNLESSAFVSLTFDLQ